MTEAPKKLKKVRSQSFSTPNWQASKLRFSHNEIERKRRARLKSETDFLHRQLPQAVYRDKLAVFKAGTDMLVRYTAPASSETRSLILTDKEYSACVVSSFDGFGMRIQCHDGVILMTTDNLQQYLGPHFSPCVGKTLSNLIVSDSLTESLIHQNLTLSIEEKNHLAMGQIVPRNFVLPLVTLRTPEEPWCFVEFCGDIVSSVKADDDDEQSNVEDGREDFVLQVLCRVLDQPLPSFPDKIFSLRLQPSTYTILELSGRSLPAGMSSSNMIGQSLLDLVSPMFRSITEAGLQNAELSGEAIFRLDGLKTSSGSIEPDLSADYKVVVKGIRVGHHLHCLVANFCQNNQQSNSDDKIYACT